MQTTAAGRRDVNGAFQRPVLTPHQYRLGLDFGVTGTPALVLLDGTLLPGYRPAADLLALLGIQ